MKESERRDTRRSPIQVLVRCLPPGTPSKRNGHEARGWEMWARDIGDDGVGLRWSQSWATQRCPSCSLGISTTDKKKQMVCECTPPTDTLKAGQEVELDGLVYSDKGSEPMRGLIRWVRPAKNGKTYDVGVHITTPNHQDFFKTLEVV